MPKLVPIKPKRLAKLLIKLGFEARDAEGSHTLYKHPDGRTTVLSVHDKEIGRGLQRKILRDIQISLEEYDSLR